MSARISLTPKETARTHADRLRRQLAEAVDDLNDHPPVDPVARLLAVAEINRLRADLREAEGENESNRRGEPRHIAEILNEAFKLVAKKASK